MLIKKVVGHPKTEEIVLKRLGSKAFVGTEVTAGSILVRQRGT